MLLCGAMPPGPGLFGRPRLQRGPQGLRRKLARRRRGWAPAAAAAASSGGAEAGGGGTGARSIPLLPELPAALEVTVRTVVYPTQPNGFTVLAVDWPGQQGPAVRAAVYMPPGSPAALGQLLRLAGPRWLEHPRYGWQINAESAELLPGLLGPSEAPGSGDGSHTEEAQQPQRDPQARLATPMRLHQCAALRRAPPTPPACAEPERCSRTCQDCLTLCSSAAAAVQGIVRYLADAKLEGLTRGKAMALWDHFGSNLLVRERLAGKLAVAAPLVAAAVAPCPAVTAATAATARKL